MFVSPAYAQGAGGASGADFITSFIPIILLIVIFWFLIFRPQQKRMKAHRAMLDAIKRGDTVVTNGGLVGKVTKVTDGEDFEVEIAAGTKVRVVRGMISDVRTKSEPVNDNTAAKEESEAAAAKKPAPRRTTRKTNPKKPAAKDTAAKDANETPDGEDKA